jgi:hypothetical protein
VNTLSKAAVFIFKIQDLSDSNMPGRIIRLASSLDFYEDFKSF